MIPTADIRNTGYLIDFMWQCPYVVVLLGGGCVLSWWVA